MLDVHPSPVHNAPVKTQWEKAASLVPCEPFISSFCGRWVGENAMGFDAVDYIKEGRKERWLGKLMVYAYAADVILCG